MNQIYTFQGKLQNETIKYGIIESNDIIEIENLENIITKFNISIDSINKINSKKEILNNMLFYKKYFHTIIYFHLRYNKWVINNFDINDNRILNLFDENRKMKIYLCENDLNNRVLSKNSCNIKKDFKNIFFFNLNNIDIIPYTLHKDNHHELEQLREFIENDNVISIFIIPYEFDFKKTMEISDFINTIKPIFDAHLFKYEDEQKYWEICKFKNSIEYKKVDIL